MPHVRGRLVVDVDLGHMLIDALLEFWPKLGADVVRQVKVLLQHEAFVCRCGKGDVVLRESLRKTSLDVIFLWKEERVRLLVASLGVSTSQISSAGPSTPPSDSPRPSKNEKC
ncbi:hypothetical protein Tco_0841244 [Tanacetum coccineum]|uniref:Uncharacterized protein n=1 Tax=Tanacetum coccineum TaxID=301880 RepID=A0ABQ5AY34_9ASTR